MAKKNIWSKYKLKLNERQLKTVVLPAFVVIALFASTLTVWSVVLLMQRNNAPGTQMGVGADGFQAYIEENGDLGVTSIVTKDIVAKELGKKAKSVGDAKTSEVFNYNGDRGQTLEFPVVRKDGENIHIYIDKRVYKSPQSIEADNIYAATATAGAVNGLPAYYKLAQSIDGDREYHMIVVNGQTLYRFVLAQPIDKIEISEIEAVAVLKKIALKSQLK
jgi:hypothetical protein